MTMKGLSLYPAPAPAPVAAPADVSAARDALLIALTAAKQEIEAGDVASIQPVLDALLALPQPDLGAILASYGAARAADVTGLGVALGQAIAAIPRTDVAAALTAYGAAKPADLQPLLDAIHAIPAPAPVDLSLIATKQDLNTSEDRTSEHLEALHDDLINRIAAIPAPAPVDLSLVAKKSDLIAPATPQNVTDAQADIEAKSAASHTATQGWVTGKVQLVLDLLNGAITTLLNTISGKVDAVKADTASLLTNQAANVTTLAQNQATLIAGQTTVTNNVNTHTDSVVGTQAGVTQGKVDAVKADTASIKAAVDYIGQVIELAGSAPLPAGFTVLSKGPVSGPYSIGGVQGIPSTPATGTRVTAGPDGVHATVIATAMSAHSVFDEVANTWASLPTSSMAYQGTLTQGMFSALPDGTYLTMGGSSTTADNVTCQKYNPASATWSGMANVPAGGWGGGLVMPRADGKLCWLPSHSRQGGTTAVANTNTWLIYDVAGNAWTTVVSAFVLPAGALVASPGATAPGWAVQLPSMKYAVAGTGTSWAIVDPVACTVTAKGARPLSNGVVAQTPTGWAGVAAGSRSVYYYTEATDSWTTVTTGGPSWWLFPSTLNTNLLGYAPQMLNGYYHVGFNSGGAAYALVLAPYSGVTYKAQRTALA